MKRVEIIANRSVESEIIEALEEAVEDFFYTMFPQAHGKGKTKYRLGTATWPELNFFLVSYLEDENAARVEEAIRSVKKLFPREGIKLFMLSL